MPTSQGFRGLRVYQLAFQLAMEIFQESKNFPPEEKYSLTDQMRRSSRSVCTNIGEAWRKRRYPPHFVSKMSDSEGEAEETRVWVEFAQRCCYLSTADATDLDNTYDRIQLVHMILNKDHWIIRSPKSVSK